MSDKAIEKMSFEEALQELESIVEKLEHGDAPLEESINIYQRGALLKSHCETKLKNAQLKVDKIVLDGQDPTGQVQVSTEKFDS